MEKNVKLYSLLGNTQKLDGGAMFGNAPKVLWEKWMHPDELNRIQLATRSLLVRTKNHTIVFEVGIGAYMDPKYRERYGVVETEHMLLKVLDQNGFSHKDITDIILSHLHFTSPRNAPARPHLHPGRYVLPRNPTYPEADPGF